LSIGILFQSESFHLHNPSEIQDVVDIHCTTKGIDTLRIISPHLYSGTYLTRHAQSNIERLVSGTHPPKYNENGFGIYTSGKRVNIH
jgi:hypothetical protein